MKQKTKINSDADKRPAGPVKQKMDSVLDKIYRYDAEHNMKIFSFIARGCFKIFGWFYYLAYIPFVRNRIEALDPDESDMTWLPINKNIEGGDGIALPEEVIDRIIEKSNYLVRIDFCACRIAYKCDNYPSEIGCLFMGESAKKISKKMAREVSVEEAKAHARKAVESGLVPIIGEARADHDLLNIPAEHKLMTLCFCCECCCVARFFANGPEDIITGITQPVEGLSIEVTDDCNGCGTCVSKCYLKAISIKNGRSVKSGYCRLCGRCASACPQNAIKLKLDNPKAVDDVVSRVLARVDIS